MSRTDLREVKGIVNAGFYPNHYLSQALASDAKAAGVSPDPLKTKRMDFNRLIGRLTEADAGSVGVVRQELIDTWYKTLGYFELGDRCQLKTECELMIGGQAATITIPRRVELHGNKTVWLMDDLGDPESPQVVDGGEDESGAEHFYQQEFPLTIGKETRLIPWHKIIDGIFDSDYSRAEWLIINQGERLILVERGRWQEFRHSCIAVNTAELFAVHSDDTYRMVLALFGTDAFPIASANYFHETLDQNSHKKAAEVTKSLRNTVRDSIELIANAVLDYHYEVGIARLDQYDLLTEPDKSAAAKLVFDQALRYTYRMLFMLYAEGYTGAKDGLPVNSKAYQMGYSIEKLRDLESKPLIDGQNNFIQQTLDMACRIYFEGYNTDLIREYDEHTGEDQVKTDAFGFAFPKLGTQLFDPAYTDLVTATKLPDYVMQKVLYALSLARTGTGNNARTYRVHYGSLSINQLGAVYEGLLSLKPEILAQDSYLLAKSKKDLACGFVPKNQKVADKQYEKDGEGKRILKEAGTFILTPVGLDRKFSASFYTPEVLTKCLAEQSVKLLLEDKNTLEELEDLKILEPAMGSGAFLVAVVEELAPVLAKRYKERDEEQGLELTSTTHYTAQAKDHLMRHCIYGVDLNPTAVELAKISLWLYCIDKDGNLPFLDYKLRSGNSLVGCWFTRFQKNDLPHFVLPHPSALDTMIDGKVLGERKWPFIADDEDRDWVKDRRKQWDKAWDDKALLARAAKLKAAIADLYADHVAHRQEMQDAIRAAESTTEKATVFAELQKTDYAYNQLRAMADYWCALWYWPVTELGCLPDPEEYLTALEFFAGVELAYAGEERVRQLESAGIPSLLVARDVSLEQNFFHWDLEYPLVFERGGFDLVLGNPPWAKVCWEDKDYFEEVSPGLHVVKMDARGYKKKYLEVATKNESTLAGYIQKRTTADGFGGFLKDSATFRHRDSSKTNTYRYFFQRFREIAGTGAHYCYIAQDGIFTDRGCVAIREVAYKEVTDFHRFNNMKNLFEDVDGNATFQLSYYRKSRERIDFDLIDNLFLPETIGKCYRESELVEYRGVRNGAGLLELRGHPARVVRVTESLLKNLGKFQGNPSIGETKLPSIHGTVELNVLLHLARHPEKMAGRFTYSSMFNESNAPRNSLIVRKAGISSSIEESVLTGPNLFVGNPAFQNPNIPCKSRGDFYENDLTNTPDDFYPATVYQITERGKVSGDYLTENSWVSKHKDHYRVFSRAMVNLTGGRTLSSAIIPPGPSHIHSIMSLSFDSRNSLVTTSSLFNSIVFDFLSRSVSGGHIVKNIVSMMPTLTETQLTHPLTPGLMIRALRLSSISTYYAPLWKDTFQQSFKDLEFPSEFAPTLPYSKLTDTWERHSALRCPKQREQALCETDAIVAILFDFDKDTLLNLYRAQFGVLQKNLQDLPEKEINPEKYHFPRYQAMADAYDHALEFTQSKDTKKKRA